MAATRRRRVLVASALAALLAACQHREGRLVRPLPSSESILGQASHVARVRVVARDPIGAPYKRGTVSCGSYYRVQVIDALKGESGETLDFVSDEALDVAAEYLVAVRESPGSLDPAARWTSSRLRCGAGYQRQASAAARVEPGDDGMVVVVRGSRMIPERIREEAVRGRVPWPTVKRELFAAAPPEKPLEQQVEELAQPEAAPAEPAAPAPEPEPQPTAPEHAPEKESPWIWEWDPF